MASETHGFQAEVSRLLDIVAHSIYSDKAVFLRELISNASDACDRLRYLALTQAELTAGQAEVAARGTTIILHLRKGEEEYLEADRLRRIVTTHSDHVGLPIKLIEDGKETVVNAASALWTRAKSEITPAQYTEFYHHVAHAFDDPWLPLHFRAEGKIEYTALVFVPATKPFDLFHPDRKHALKLYVRRVFITDDCEDVLPAWLRFLRGIVGSEDLPLSLSREMLQHNPLLAKIRTRLVKRVLSDLEKKAEKAPEDYAKFWDNFGAVLKEGLYEDTDQRDKLLGLVRFRSTAGDGLVSLSDYVARMKSGQNAIYYISGEAGDTLTRSPQLEGFRARGVEV